MTRDLGKKGGHRWTLRHPLRLHEDKGEKAQIDEALRFADVQKRTKKKEEHHPGSFLSPRPTLRGGGESEERENGLL